MPGSLYRTYTVYDEYLNALPYNNTAREALHNVEMYANNMSRCYLGI